MAKSHVSRIAPVLDQIDVTAVCDIIKEQAQAVADLLPNKPYVTDNWKELYDKVDGVLLVLPHHLHCEATLDFLNAGIHVLVEKPMALTEQECQSMIQASERMKRVLMVAYCVRFNPMVVKLRELIRNKVYGDCFQLSIWTEQLTKYDEGNWAHNAKTLGGGQLFSHGCHYIDIMLWIMGDPISGVHIGTNFGTPWMEREGTSNVTIKFANGALGYHMGTWGARGTRNRYTIHAHCTDGMLEANLSEGKLYIHSNASKHIPGMPANQTTAVLGEYQTTKATPGEMAHFVECLRTGALPLTNGYTALQSLRAIWRMYEAEDKGTVADLRGLGVPM